METRDFFISYAKQDEALAQWVALTLESDGFTVYIMGKDIRTGDNFVKKMNEFLKYSRNFIAVWSAAYNASSYCMDELESAYIQEKHKHMTSLLLLRAEEHPIEPLYSRLVHKDLFSMTFAMARHELLDAAFYAVLKLTPEAVKRLDGSTLYSTGNDYFYGRNGKEQDYEKAKYYFEWAAEKGVAEALDGLGYMYLHGLGVDVDYKTALDYYNQAAEKGNAAALNSLGYMYQDGLGVDVDYKTALDYYNQAAEKGVSSAYYNLGWTYEYGCGVEQDYEKALEYYQKAADFGDEDAPAKVDELTKLLNE